MDAFTFEGTASIVLTTSEDCATNEITLHAKELCFISAHYSVGDEPEVDAQEFRVGLKTTTATLIFTEELPANRDDVLLTIKYTGFLNNQMAGFYRSSYTNIHGETKIMASTQFEALDARRAFPCWDEPARKAVFGVTLIVPNHLDCLSNMPTKSCQSLGNTKRYEFLDSPIMSTYLLGKYEAARTDLRRSSNCQCTNAYMRHPIGFSLLRWRIRSRASSNRPWRLGQGLYTTGKVQLGTVCP